MKSELFEKDWLFLLETVYHLNELTDQATFQKNCLEYIRLNIPFCQGLFYAYRVEEGKLISLEKPVVLGDKPLYLEEFHERYAVDTLFGRHLLATHCETIRDTDMYPDEVRMQTDWYRNIYAKQGIHYALRITLIHNRKAVGEIDLFRPKNSNDFSDADMRLLDLLAPHLAQKLWTLVYPETPPANLDDLKARLADIYQLTPRESEVVAAIVHGTPNQDVAGQLCISTSTLKKHVHNAYRKMGISNRRQLFAVVSTLD